MATTKKTEKECDEAIKEFAEITGKDEAFAHAILQDVDYELEEAVVRYYSSIDDGPLPESILREVEAAGLAPLAPRPASIDRGNSLQPINSEEEPANSLDQEPVPSATKPKIEAQARLPPDVTVLSYNVDGLDVDALQTRFAAVMMIVAKVNPDVIFFQEFVKAMEPKMNQILGKLYHIISGYCGVPYYTVTCVAKCIRIENQEIVKYQTQMGRNMLCIEGKWRGMNVRLINSHLESCAEQSGTRRMQFKQAMDKMAIYSSQPDTLAIFGGDLNLRDSEVSNIPDGVEDAWIAAGSNPAFKFTWDTKLNDNKQLPKMIRTRFDRLYIKSPYQKMEFYLEGKQKIEGCDRFPSDHFAIVAKLTAPKLE